MDALWIKKKLEEAYFVAPNDLGHPLLTQWYKSVTRFLKTIPFIYIIPFSLLVSLTLFAVSNWVSVLLVTRLQSGY
jgi:hypothetical protein